MLLAIKLKLRQNAEAVCKNTLTARLDRALDQLFALVVLVHPTLFRPHCIQHQVLQLHSFFKKYLPVFLGYIDG